MDTSNNSIIFIEEIQAMMSREPSRDESKCSCSINCSQLATALSKRKREDDREDDSGDGSDDDSDDGSDDQESLSEKRARWYLEDRERDDCLQTIWKLDDDMDDDLTSNCEYSPASPEVCTSWCYTCDYAWDLCKCDPPPWSPSTYYNPCEVCERERCNCLRLPVKQDIECITLD
jgi:hypothetical protein